MYPVDLIGSIFHLLCIDGEAKLPNVEGLPVRVLPTSEDGVLSKA